MKAKEVCGRHIGMQLMWEAWHPYKGSEWHMTEPIKSVWHGGNNHVIITHGKDNKETFLAPYHEYIEVRKA